MKEDQLFSPEERELDSPFLSEIMPEQEGFTALPPAVDSPYEEAELVSDDTEETFTYENNEVLQDWEMPYIEEEDFEERGEDVEKEMEGEFNFLGDIHEEELGFEEMLDNIHSNEEGFEEEFLEEELEFEEEANFLEEELDHELDLEEEIEENEWEENHDDLQEEEFLEEDEFEEEILPDHEEPDLLGKESYVEEDDFEDHEYRISDTLQNINQFFYTAWYIKNAAQKKYFPDEPKNNHDQFSLPPWFKASLFYQEFIAKHGESARIIIGDSTKAVSAQYFVIHDTAGTYNYNTARLTKRKGKEHLFINNGVLPAKKKGMDWHVNGRGLKVTTKSNPCFVHVEMVRAKSLMKQTQKKLKTLGLLVLNRKRTKYYLTSEARKGKLLQLVQQAGGVRAFGTYYTDLQYELLAYAYLVASVRKGKLLTVTIHREADRSVIRKKADGGFQYGHDDPQFFDIEYFYQIVAKLLRIPASIKATFGIQHNRVWSLGNTNLGGYENVFVAYVQGQISAANQYGAPKKINIAGHPNKQLLTKPKGSSYYYLVNRIKARFGQCGKTSDFKLSSYSNNSSTTNIPLPTPSSQINIPKAIRRNQHYSQALRWDNRRFDIYKLLGFHNRSPTPGLFAEKVADWQKQVGFTGKDVDGIIGPKTWVKMQQSLRQLVSNIPVPIPTSSTNLGTNTAIGGIISGSLSQLVIVKQWGDSSTISKHMNDLVFAKLPNLQRQPYENMGPSDKKQYRTTWIQIGRELIHLRKKIVGNNFIPPLGGSKIPFGFQKNIYKGIAGLKVNRRYKITDRLDQTLVNLQQQGKININQNQLDIFQRIANVETSGSISTLNTYDRGVVSIGFMQFTVHVGKIQKWVNINPLAFKKFGIELDPQLKYNFGKNGIYPAFKGVAQSTIDELRWNGWAERFHYAAFDPEVIAAEVQLALHYLSRHLKGLKSRVKSDAIFKAFKDNYYNHNAYVRGLLQASYNNNPARSAKCVKEAIQEVGLSASDRTHFLKVYTRILREKGWERLVRVTATGTNLSI